MLTNMGRRLTDKEKAWRSLSEKQFQSQVIELARTLGWLVAHFHDSRRQVTRPDGKRFFIGDKDAKGFPDVCMVHPKHGVVFMELKKELGKTTPDQDEWIAALKRAGETVLVARPSTWDHLVDWLQKGFPDDLE